MTSTCSVRLHSLKPERTQLRLFGIGSQSGIYVTCHHDTSAVMNESVLDQILNERSLDGCALIAFFSYIYLAICCLNLILSCSICSRPAAIDRMGHKIERERPTDYTQQPPWPCCFDPIASLLEVICSICMGNGNSIWMRRGCQISNSVHTHTFCKSTDFL